jgi:hypothetical protein
MTDTTPTTVPDAATVTAADDRRDPPIGTRVRITEAFSGYGAHLADDLIGRTGLVCSGIDGEGDVRVTLDEPRPVHPASGVAWVHAWDVITDAPDRTPVPGDLVRVTEVLTGASSEFERIMRGALATYVTAPVPYGNRHAVAATPIHRAAMEAVGIDLPWDRLTVDAVVAVDVNGARAVAADAPVTPTPAATGSVNDPATVAAFADATAEPDGSGDTDADAIVALRAALDAANARADREALRADRGAALADSRRDEIAAFEDWKRILVEDAHQTATDRDWCGEFDDFMEDHGLPRREREWEVTVQATVTVTRTVTASSEDDAKSKAEEAFSNDDIAYELQYGGADVADIEVTYVT